MRTGWTARRGIGRAPADGVLFAAFLIDTTIAVIDAFTAAVLINLVVVGPLIAATRVGPRRTALISLYAVALGLYEGIPHGIFGSVDHIIRCTAIALTGGLAVWSSWLRQRSETAQRHVALLAEAGAVLTASLDDAATTRNIANVVVRGLADCCAVHTFDRRGNVRNVAAAHGPHATQDLAEALRAWAAASHAEGDAPTETLRAAILPLVGNSAGDGDGDAQDRPPAAVMVVPMTAREHTLGAITFVKTHARRPFDDGERQTAAELASRCALALDNVEQYQERSRVAGTLQDSLLPARLPRVPGFEVAARFHAADEVEVGGDFFDVFPTADGWAAVIGDVTGKGAGAASVTAMARYTVRAVAHRAPGPADVMHALNDGLLREGHDERFCTAMYAELREADGGTIVRLCNAGHPPALVIRADGRVEQVAARGMALGIAPDPPLGHAEIALAAGEKVVLYTDGVTEARLSSGMLGTDGLAAGLAGSGADDAVRTGERVYRAAEPSSASPNDDIAVLVLRAAPPGGRPGDEGLARTGASGRRGVLHLLLRGGPSAPGAARRALDALELPLLAPADAHRASLLVSEIVSNSVRHADGDASGAIDFDADLTPGLLAVEVREEGAGFRLDPRRPPPDEASRRGLVLIDRLADRWGMRDEGRAVWFELDRGG
jgi:serine phosphatase RsbU (regulator of sigma subunit)/anti-sigma regulatory factor (Ser/Thr protein kinase)